MKKNTKVFAGIVFLIMYFSSLPLSAWQNHYLITRYYLEKNHPELKEIIITIPSSSEPIKDINPSYNPDSPAIEEREPCSDINFMKKTGLDFNFCPDDKSFFTPGRELSALDIVSFFSDEPDWGIDRNLSSGITGNFMGGSQGMRHLYYPFPYFKLPFIFFPQGEADGRAQVFFNRAIKFFQMGNLYEGFRNLGRSIHYIEDISQPMHTFQTCLHFINIKKPVSGTSEITKNFHSAFEKLIMLKIFMEISGIDPPYLLRALENKNKESFRNISHLVRVKARQSSSPHLCSQMLKNFPEKLKKSEKVRLSLYETFILLKKESMKTVFDIAFRGLKNLNLEVLFDMLNPHLKFLQK